MTNEQKQPQDQKQPKERKKRKRGGRRAHGTGSVFQRADRKGKQWVAQIVLENGKTRQRYFWTQAEAADALNEMLYEHRHGTLITEKDQTMKQHFERWLEVHKSKIRWATYLGYRRILNNHILPTLGHLSLQQLSARDLDEFYAQKLEEGLSPISIKNIHLVIHMALKQAVRWRLVARNVSEDVSPPRDTQSHQRQTLTPEQAQKLLAAAKGHRLEAMLTLALAIGIRRGELLGLQWQDIDFKHKCLHVQRSANRLPGGYCVTDPKTASGKRTITLPQFVLEALGQHRIRQLEAKLKAGSAWEEHDLVFCNIYGRFLNSASLQVLFSKLLKKAQLPHMRFHDLRHSAATILLAMGVPIKVVQELLGHKDINTTLNVYGHVLASMQQEAMDKLDDLFGKGEDNKDEEKDSGHP
jgi:integrase